MRSDTIFGWDMDSLRIFERAVRGFRREKATRMLFYSCAGSIFNVNTYLLVWNDKNNSIIVRLENHHNIL